jgi:hypothetical protein
MKIVLGLKTTPHVANFLYNPPEIPFALKKPPVTAEE